MTLGPEVADDVVAALSARFEDSPGLRGEITTALAALRGSGFAVKRLAESLRAADPDVRCEAVKSLGTLGGDPKEVLPALLAALKDPEALVRQAAAESLAAVKDPNALDGLIAALGDDEPAVTAAVAAALGAIGGTRAAGALVPLLDALDDKVREAVTVALAAVGEPAVDPLIRALRSDNAQVRVGAAWVLGKVGAVRAVEALLAAQADRSWTAADNATSALIEIGEPAIRLLSTGLESDEKGIRLGSAWALSSMGAVAVDALVAALGSAKWATRWRAAEALGRIGDRRAVGPLIQALKDPHGTVRMAAVASLGSIGDSKAAGPLTRAVADPVWIVRLEAAWALGQIGQEDAVAPLERAAKDNNEAVVDVAREALQLLQDRLGTRRTR